jgi:hypothetical protein
VVTHAGESSVDSLFVARDGDEDHQENCDDSDSSHGAIPLRAPFERFIYFYVVRTGEFFQ